MKNQRSRSFERVRGRSLRGVALMVGAALALGLGGCRSVWVHSQWSTSRYHADLGECSQQPHWKGCMRARGWDTEPGWIWATPTRSAHASESCVLLGACR